MLCSVDGVTAPLQPEWSRSVYHLYVVRVQDRTGLQKQLAEAKIDTGIHYPVPLHLQQAYKHFGYKQGDFPVTEQVSSEILSLPMYPQLEAEQQRTVVQKTAEFVAVGSLQ
jgi:dTDP-4-amino-4,6-dideoxygalactose transaminase